MLCAQPLRRGRDDLTLCCRAWRNLAGPLLVQYLARTRRPKDAEAVLRQAEKKLPKKESVLALAQCYEAIGNRVQAEKFIEAAIAAAPTKAAEVAARQSAVARTCASTFLIKPKPSCTKSSN